MIEVRNPVLWVYAALTLVGAVGVAPLLWGAAHSAPVGFAVALGLWAGFAWGAWRIIRRMSRTRPRPATATAMAFAWGVVVVPGLARWASPAIADLAHAAIPDPAWAEAVAAGITEEPLKLLGVLALSLLAFTRMRTVLDFVYYGAFVGLGFMVTESLLYSAAGAAESASPILTVVLYVVLRGFMSALWSHPTYTAIAAVGLAWGLRGTGAPLRRWLGFAGLLMVAIATHAFYDSPLGDFNQLFAATVMGLPAFAVFLALYLPQRRREAPPQDVEEPEHATAPA